MKDKQRSRHEEHQQSNKFEYLLPSPPPQQKTNQDSHFQSSSSPVGRPPPIIENTDINNDDIRLLEDLKNFLSSNMYQQEEEIHSQSLLPPFIENEFDVHLFDTNDNDSLMSFGNNTDNDQQEDFYFFPSLSDKK